MIKEKMLKLGNVLSSMILPNIGALVAWGLIVAFFGEHGWFPNLTIAGKSITAMVNPMINFLIPLLIAYTGGKNVWDTRGGVAGAVSAIGIIIGSPDTPMFLGAMIFGPLGAWCIKKFDKAVEGKITADVRLLVDFFSLGIITMIITLCGYLFVGVVIRGFTMALKGCFDFLIGKNLAPLLSFIVDPLKVLFLNNVVNWGALAPAGLADTALTGQSLIFLVDPNPGPGLGLLLACFFFGKGEVKTTAPGAMVVEFIGGIHEIYFPYVLIRPILLLPLMAGNISALVFYSAMKFGLVAPAAPGSVISIMLMSNPEAGGPLVGLAGVLIGVVVSFLISMPIIKSKPDLVPDNVVNQAREIDL